MIYLEDIMKKLTNNRQGDFLTIREDDIWSDEDGNIFFYCQSDEECYSLNLQVHKE